MCDEKDQLVMFCHILTAAAADLIPSPPFVSLFPCYCSGGRRSWIDSSGETGKKKRKRRRHHYLFSPTIFNPPTPSGKRWGGKKRSRGTLTLKRISTRLQALTAIWKRRSLNNSLSAKLFKDVPQQPPPPFFARPPNSHTRRRRRRLRCCPG